MWLKQFKAACEGFIDYESYYHLYWWQNHAPKPTVLNFSNVYLGDDCGRAVINWLPSGYIEVLDLTNTSISDYVFFSSYKALKWPLRKIILDGNSVSRNTWWLINKSLARIEDLFVDHPFPSTTITTTSSTQSSITTTSTSTSSSSTSITTTDRLKALEAMLAKLLSTPTKVSAAVPVTESQSTTEATTVVTTTVNKVIEGVAPMVSKAIETSTSTVSTVANYVMNSTHSVVGISKTSTQAATETLMMEKVTISHENVTGHTTQSVLGYANAVYTTVANYVAPQTENQTAMANEQASDEVDHSAYYAFLVMLVPMFMIAAYVVRSKYVKVQAVSTNKPTNFVMNDHTLNSGRSVMLEYTGINGGATADGQVNVPSYGESDVDLYSGNTYDRAQDELDADGYMQPQSVTQDGYMIPVASNVAPINHTGYDVFNTPAQSAANTQVGGHAYEYAASN